MNYLIFGGGGFIGTHLAKYIKQQDNSEVNIFNLDIQKKQNADSQFTYVDVRQTIDFPVNYSQKSVIFNLAAVHTTPGHLDFEYFETNISGAENICNFARRNSISTIIFTSSIAPYGASEALKTENTLATPNTPYGISKLTAEYIHRIWQAEKPDSRRLVIIRPGVVFGSGENGNFTRLYKSLKKRIFFYPGRKDTIKACVYINDVVRILYETSADESPEVLLLNLSFSPAPTIEEICLSIANATALTPPKITVPAILLKYLAGFVFLMAKIFGKNLNGIHPDRVKKLMMSTNISGEKLKFSNYSLKYNLNEAIADWYNYCSKKGLF